jgi:hypothetical protein
MNGAVFWDSIRNNSGWGWALGELGRRPAFLAERGPNFGESPLHWALLSHLEATIKICQEAPDLLSSVDVHGRTPLDWAIEKIYFLKERQEGELLSDKARTASMIEPARACALFALNWVESQGVADWSTDCSRWVQWALTAGELDVALRGEICGGSEVSLSVWLCGLAGLWTSETDALQYVRFLSTKNIGPDSVVFGRPLGLHVASLWVDGGVSSERAMWFHRAGLRLDAETETESVEVFCGRLGEVGALRWDAMSKMLEI